MSDDNLASIKLGASQIFLFEENISPSEIIDQMGTALHSLGFVKDSYTNAVLEREKIFPTGLPTNPIGVAIPHTDAEHVISDAIAIGILHDPVQFEEMGTSGGNSMVDVSIITMLAISQPKSMVPLLSQLAGCYQDGEFLSALHVERDTAKIISLFKEKVPQIKVIP